MGGYLIRLWVHPSKIWSDVMPVVIAQSHMWATRKKILDTFHEILVVVSFQDPYFFGLWNHPLYNWGRKFHALHIPYTNNQGLETTRCQPLIRLLADLPWFTGVISIWHRGPQTSCTDFFSQKSRQNSPINLCIKVDSPQNKSPPKCAPDLWRVKPQASHVFLKHS